MHKYNIGQSVGQSERLSIEIQTTDELYTPNVKDTIISKNPLYKNSNQKQSVKSTRDQKLIGRKSPIPQTSKISIVSARKDSGLDSKKQHSSKIQQYAQNNPHKRTNSNASLPKQLKQSASSNSLIDFKNNFYNNPQHQEEEFLTSSFQSTHQEIQASFDQYPNAPLKDVGISGVTGGSSSKFARQEVTLNNVYVPLKKRLADQNVMSSPSIDQSILDSKQQQLNIKKVQVNLGVKIQQQYPGLAKQKSQLNTSIQNSKSNIRQNTTVQQKKQPIQNNQQTKKGSSVQPKKLMIRSNSSQQITNIKGVHNTAQKSNVPRDRSSSTRYVEETPQPKVIKQYEVVQILVSLEASNKKPKKSLLGYYGKTLKRAFNRYKLRQMKEKFVQKLENMKVKEEWNNYYQQYEQKIKSIQQFQRGKKEDKNNKSTFKYIKQSTNKVKLLKSTLTGFYYGWKLRKIYNSKFVKNAITQYVDYIKFTAEMEMDPSVNDAMRKQFKANLPRSKQQIKETIDRLWSDPNWLSKINSDKTQTHQRLQKKQFLQKNQKGVKRQEVNLAEDLSQRPSLGRSESVGVPTIESKAWWEISEEKNKLKTKTSMKLNNNNDSHSKLIKQNNQQRVQQATEQLPSENISNDRSIRDLTPQPQKQFLKKKSQLKYDPLQQARDSKKQLKAQQKSMIEQSILISQPSIIEDPSERYSSITSLNSLPKFKNLNNIQETIKNEKSIELMITTINNTIEKYEQLIRAHQSQLNQMSQTQQLQSMLLLKSQSPDRNTQQINLKELGLLNASNQGGINQVLGTSTTTNNKLHQKLSVARSPSTTMNSNPFMRESIGSLNESILNEKTSNKEGLMRSFMPSQKVAYIKMKNKEEEDHRLWQQTMRHGRSGSTANLAVPGLNVGAGPYQDKNKVAPTFTKTGLMLTSADPFVKAKQQKNKYKRNKQLDMTSASSKHQPPLSSIKEASIDLSYLKNVKSKVDCWTSRLSNLPQTGATEPSTQNQEESKERSKSQINDVSSQKHSRKHSISPMKSPKKVDQSQLNKSQDQSLVNQTNENNLSRNQNTNLNNTNSSPAYTSKKSSAHKHSSSMKIKKVRESLDDELCNQESPKNDDDFKQELTIIKPVMTSPDEIEEKLKALDQMNQILKDLKQKFQDNQNINKEDLKDLIEQDYEMVLSDLKEEYQQMFQSNRNIVNYQNEQLEKQQQQILV